MAYVLASISWLPEQMIKMVMVSNGRMLGAVAGR